MPRCNDGKGLFVYLLRCGDGTYYGGMTTDLERRLREHQARTGRCKYTRRSDKQPVMLAAAWTLEGVRGDALRLEAALKGLPRVLKQQLDGHPERLKELLEARDIADRIAFRPVSPALYDFKEEGNETEG